MYSPIIQIILAIGTLFSLSISMAYTQPTQINHLVQCPQAVLCSEKNNTNSCRVIGGGQGWEIMADPKAICHKNMLFEYEQARYRGDDEPHKARCALASKRTPCAIQGIWLTQTEKNINAMAFYPGKWQKIDNYEIYDCGADTQTCSFAIVSDKTN